MKKLFTNSRLGIGTAIGVTIGYLMGGNPLDGLLGGVLVGTLLVVVAENMIMNRK